MNLNRWIRIAALATLGAATTLPLLAQTVKVTPLGGIEGELCPQDRALVFEDPNGTRILYDPGRTVAGAEDPRLGKIDIVLVSHLHGDHAGNAHNKAPNSGSCESPDIIAPSAAPAAAASSSRPSQRAPASAAHSVARAKSAHGQVGSGVSLISLPARSAGPARGRAP